jgi:hypothetical protein
MGGYGSGPQSSKQKVEECRSLNVNCFRREGGLTPGKTGDWMWSRDGEEIARVGFKAEDGRLVLDYRVRLNGGDWEPIPK